MAEIQYWVNYTIFFRDQSEYQFALSLAGGSESNPVPLAMAPREAAQVFGIPYPYPSGNMESVPKGMIFYPPLFQGGEILFPGPSGKYMQDDVLTMIVPGQPGNPASIFPAGPNGKFTWSANIMHMAGAGAADDLPPNAIARRRFIGGRELTGYTGAVPLEGGVLSIPSNNYSLEASRVLGGGGLLIRSPASASVWTRNVAEYITGLTTPTSWERFYIRVRNLPTTNNVGIWRVRGNTSPASGFALKLTTGGFINGYHINATSAETDAGSIFAPFPETWHRIDTLIKFQRGAGSTGIIKIFVDGVLVATIAAPTNVGLNQNDFHQQSELGVWTSGADVTAEIDLDDWINCDLPGNCDSDTLEFIDENFSIDWLLGSHVRLHHGVAVSQTDWAGAGLGIVNQGFIPFTRLGTSELASVISGATLEALSDVQTLDIANTDTLGLTLGAAAALVSSSTYNTFSTTSTGRLGYKKAGEAAVTNAINQSPTEAPRSALYNPSGMVLPEEIAPWSAVQIKSTDVNNSRVTMLMSLVEYLGVWGPEDDPTLVAPVPRINWTHNAHYFNTQFGYFASTPDQPVFALGGTYVGNGTYQEILLPGPCHFLWIRGLTVGSAGIKFYGASSGPHYGVKDRVIPNVRIWYDSDAMEYKFSVTGVGSGTECNDNGVTYQYIAFCDPGMRFNLCGAYAHGKNVPVPTPNPLIVTDFMADAGFIQSDLMSTVSNVIGLWFKGPGTTGVNANPLDASAVQPDGFAFTPGVLYTYAAMNASGNALASNYSLWRVADSGLDGCASVMIQVATYTGDGLTSKVITLTPTSGRFPLFVLVVPASAGAASFYRDPSHTATSSCNVDSLANSNTAITACAKDQITVGSALNTNGRIYNVFVICGSDTGMVNGLFYPTFCLEDDPWEEAKPPEGQINIMTNGGLILGGVTPITMLKDVSGIYTLEKNQHHDKLIDRQPGQSTIDVKIPDPTFKTGYLGG